MFGMIARVALTLSFMLVTVWLLSLYVPQSYYNVFREFPVKWVHVACLAALAIGVKFSSAK